MQYKSKEPIPCIYVILVQTYGWFNLLYDCYDGNNGCLSIARLMLKTASQSESKKPLPPYILLSVQCSYPVISTSFIFNESLWGVYRVL